ncbi:uncharacterized protein LOC121860840 [Homarus americanus]|nr:uncharacterized protein LOC121860840 [Homarus americanus]
MAELALANVASVIVAGAVGLGIAGIAAAFSRRHYGGRPYSYRYRHRRYRRSPVQSKNNLEKTMEIIRSEDVSGCGLRLMCEVAGLRNQHLTMEEKAILDLVGPGQMPRSGFTPKGALQEYKLAKGLGQSGGSCGQVYSTCPYSGAQLVHTVMGYLP